MQVPTFRDNVIGFLFSRKGRISACALFALILTVFLFQMYGKAYREHGYDFTSYLLSSEALVKGTNPYQTGSIFPFVYPLFLCILISPLTLLPYWLSNFLWFIFNGASLFVSALVFYKLCTVSVSNKAIMALLLFPFLILINVIQNNFLNGQVNCIVLLLCVLLLKFHLGSHKFIASLFLSTAIAIKITPLILVAYLVLRRDYRWVFVTAAISLLLVIGLPYAISGPSTIEWYGSYVTSFLHPKLLESGHASGNLTFSITSLIRALFPGTPKGLSMVLAALISLAPIFWTDVVLRRKRSADREPTLFALYLTAMLLISPMSETHHLIHLLPAFILLTLTVLVHSRRHHVAGLFVLFICLVSFLSGSFYYAALFTAVASLYGFLLWSTFNPINGPWPWPVVAGAKGKSDEP